MSKKIESANKCKVGKLSDFDPIVWKVETVPEAYVRNKYERDNNLPVLYSKNDVQNKKFIYEIGINNGTSSKTIEVPYSEIAEHFGWKSFDYLEGSYQQTIVPEWKETSL